MGSKHCRFIWCWCHTILTCELQSTQLPLWVKTQLSANCPFIGKEMTTGEASSFFCEEKEESR